MPLLQRLDPFLADLATVDQEIKDNAQFRDFLAQSERASGIDPATVDTRQAQYRIWIDNAVLGDTQAETAQVQPGRSTLTIGEWIGVHHQLPRRQLVHAVWRCDSFARIGDFLCALAVTVRYTQNTDGPVVGQVVPTDAICQMVQHIENSEYVLPTGEMASDCITRTLGLRAKVLSLDRIRRDKPIDDMSLFDRLSRTLLKR